MKDVEERECMICHERILVSEDGYWHDSITGMDAYGWDFEYGDEEFVGYICWGCAFKLANEGKGAILFGGGLAPEFYFEEASGFASEKKS